jgi:hypothetical protein
MILKKIYKSAIISYIHYKLEYQKNIIILLILLNVISFIIIAISSK